MKARAIVFDAFRSGFDPPTQKKVWEWGGEHIKISNSERSSKFDPEQTPWWKAPMECAGDYDTKQVVVVAPTGSGKSTMAEVIIPYAFAENAGNFLYASQTDEDAKFWVETRLKYAMQSCPKIMALWPDDRHKSRKLEIIFPHAAFIAGGANLSNFQEKSVRWLYGDEVWAWKAGLLREFMARHHNRWNRKVFLVSQGGTEDGEFHQEFKKSDMGEFSWKCECGECQPFSWEGMKFDIVETEEGKPDDQATAATCRMVCRSCGKEYADDIHNRRTLAMSNMDNGNGGYIQTNQAPIKAIRGFHIDSLAVWWIEWKQEVLEFLEASRLAKSGVTDKLRQWKQKRRAEFWSEDMADSQIVLHQGGFTKLEHEDGQPVDGEVRRFATIDPGGDHYWMAICAWRQGGTCRILYEGYVASDGGFENGLKWTVDKYKVEPALTFIDIGYEQDRILDLCVLHGWTGIKGDGNKRTFTHRPPNQRPVEKMFSPIHRARAKSGGIAKFFFVASNAVKDVLARMLAAGDQVEIPADVSKAFQNHMKCERRQVERNAKTGEEKAIWVRPGSKANHLFDAMCYQVAAALAMRVFDEE